MEERDIAAFEVASTFNGPKVPLDPECRLSTVVRFTRAMRIMRRYVSFGGRPEYCTLFPSFRFVI